MNKIRSFLYTLSTILIIVGALFILQNDVYGILILVLGLVLNMVYRIINLDRKKLTSFYWKEILKLLAVLFMAFACSSFILDFEQKFNLLIVAIIIDLFVNMEEISFKKKT